MSDWLSECCDAPHDNKFQFNDFMTDKPIGICSRCMEHVSFYKDYKDED